MRVHRVSKTKTVRSCDGIKVTDIKKMRHTDISIYQALLNDVCSLIERIVKRRFPELVEVEGLCLRRYEDNVRITYSYVDPHNRQLSLGTFGMTHADFSEFLAEDNCSVEQLRQQLQSERDARFTLLREIDSLKKAVSLQENQIANLRSMIRR